MFLILCCFVPTDLPDIPKRRIKSLFGDDFNATVQQDVDDTIIGYRFGDLGLGPDAVGLARPIHVRSNANGEPISTISGTMVFSEAAFQRFSQTQIEATIEHEVSKKCMSSTMTERSHLALQL